MVRKSLRPSFLAIACITAFAGASLFAQDHQAAAPVSRPSAQDTNATKSLESRGLRDLERSIFKPFRVLEPESSLEAVMERPQRPPPVPNKRAKEMMERRKNWAFMTPEEIVTGKSADDSLNPQGAGKDAEDKMLSPMDRYFQRLYGDDKKKANKNNNSAKRDSISSWNKSDSSADDSRDPDDSTSGLPESVRESQRNLKKNRDGKKDFEKSSGSGFFSDVFALERKKPTVEEERVEKERMEAYRKSLGLDPTPTFGTTFLPLFADPKDPYRISLPPALMSSTPPSPAPAPASHVALPTANPFMDSSMKGGVAPSSLTPTMPKVDPPKSYLPPQPTFAAPRRSF